jgi:hypothetical protein
VKINHIPFVHLLSAARRGDREPLARHIETGGTIPADMLELRKFIAAAVREKKQRKGGRPASEAVREENRQLALLVWFYEGTGMSHAEAKRAAAEQGRGTDVKKVERAVTAWRKGELL